MITEIEKAYAAGLIDGEGCIRIARNLKGKKEWNDQYYLEVNVHITDYEVLKWLRKKWRGSILKRKKETHWKDNWNWKITAEGAKEFLRDIQPFSIIKKREIGLALTFPEFHGQRKFGTSETIQQVRIQLKQKLSEMKVS